MRTLPRPANRVIDVEALDSEGIYDWMVRVAVAVLFPTLVFSVWLLPWVLPNDDGVPLVCGMVTGMLLSAWVAADTGLWPLRRSWLKWRAYRKQEHALEAVREDVYRALLAPGGGTEGAKGRLQMVGFDE